MSSSLGARVAIQLYPDNPNLELLDFLHAAGANPDPVLCYLYGSEAKDQRVIELIDEMAAGRVDLIAFTSSPQVQRLRRVAKESLRKQYCRKPFGARQSPPSDRLSPARSSRLGDTSALDRPIISI
jgi:uroporphyrinogen-III synthase